jgi:hypothetical protein
MKMSTLRNNTGSARPSRSRRLLVAVIALVASLTAMAGVAQAEQTINDFTVTSSTTQAGAHPDLTGSFSLNLPGEPEAAKNILVNLPTGIFGNPGGILKCSAAEFVLSECSPDSQAGIITIYANYESDNAFLLGTAPIYNMQRVSEDEAARLSFVAPTVSIPVSVPVNVRSASDYGLTLAVSGIPQTIPVNHVDFTIWGLPAIDSHEGDRFPKGSPGNPPGCPGAADTLCSPGADAGQTIRPYTHNPSLCTGAPLPTTLEVQTYQDPGVRTSKTTAYPATTGCENQQFKPVFNAGLTNESADSPSGMDLQLKADQFISLAPSPSELRSASLTLPEGLSINPDAADGQTACSDVEAGFGTENAGRCPDTSKIGTIEVHTPALDGPLQGALYFGEPKPGNQYRVFMIFDGFGVHAKIATSVLPDPQTGRLTLTVVDLPQVPFEEFDLHLFSSDRGMMATPTQCRVYETEATFVPWNDRLSPQISKPLLTVTSGPDKGNCPGAVRPFEPRLVAGMSNARGGDFSAFTLKLDRDDGDQFLRDLTFKLPPGFTGNLRGLGYCPDGAISAAAQLPGRVEQASPSCPPSSLVGTTNVAAGPGAHPFHAVGKMYLAGPFKGAPLSVAAVTPALAGPYDYGTVVVRVALHVDPLTAQVFAASDRVPSIIGGVPIRMRSIQVNIDKPSFTINPTNCEPLSVASQGIGDQETITDFTSYFQAVNCASLGFKPTMRVRVTSGRKSTSRSDNPALRFDLRTRRNDANVKSIAVTLPHAFEIDQRHLGNICSEKELAEKECAGRTPIGKAATRTPLLDDPLSGPVYAVSGSGGLPRLAFILNGQVKLVPRADTTTAKGKLKTTVPVIPDAPIGHFRLDVFGGKVGYLINTRSLCAGAKRPVIKVDYLGQNRKTRTEMLKVKAPCGKKSKQRGKR